jgi:hypothetical protein
VNHETFLDRESHHSDDFQHQDGIPRFSIIFKNQKLVWTYSKWSSNDRQQWSLDYSNLLEEPLLHSISPMVQNIICKDETDSCSAGYRIIRPAEKPDIQYDIELLSGIRSDIELLSGIQPDTYFGRIGRISDSNRISVSSLIIWVLSRLEKNIVKILASSMYDEMQWVATGRMLVYIEIFSEILSAKNIMNHVCPRF